MMLEYPSATLPAPGHWARVLAGMLAISPLYLPAQLDLNDKDSLLQRLPQVTAPLEAARTWEQLGRIYRYQHADSATLCYDQALALYRSAQYQPGIESALRRQSYHQSKLGQYTRSNALAREGIRIAQALDSSNNVINHLVQMGINFTMLGQTDSAREAYFAALREAEATGNTEQQYYALVNIGNIYYQATQLGPAID
ncbi:MAG: hypothetical protein SF053_17085 [Bacteroidia bacterium]|nr:hypothetical protein [Bacteroidia bacterium]